MKDPTLKLARWLVMLAAMLGCAGCVTATKPNLFTSSKEEVRSRVKVIALNRMSADTGISVTEQQRKDFEAYVTDELTRAGFRVVPAAVTQNIGRQESERIGGAFDPVTGQANPDKIKQLQEFTYKELAAKQQVDAVLFTRLMVVKATFTSPWAHWDGVDENCETTDFGTRFLSGIHTGTMPALSFVVTLSDMNKATLYGNRGGLQLLAKVFGQNQFVDVPKKDLLVDPKVNQNAVKLAISPLGP